jgi:TRAP-type mannitol/chloroaromatic compound transport system permease small subunit
MHTLIAVSNALDRVISRIGMTFAWAGLVLVLITVFDVVTRSFTQSSVGWLRELIAWQQANFGSTVLQEFEWHFHTALFFMAFGWTYFRNGHVRIDIFVEKRSARLRSWIELVGVAVFMVPFCLLLLYYGTEEAITSFGQKECSASATGLCQRWIIRSAVPLGMLLILLAAIATLLRKIVKLFGPSTVRRGFESEFFPEQPHGSGGTAGA